MDQNNQRTFERIGVCGKREGPKVAETLAVLVDYLQARDREVLPDAATCAHLPEHKLEAASEADIGGRANLIVVVGGDGTLLTAARTYGHQRVPLLGVNLGRLGFLVDVLPDDMCRCLDEVFSGRFREEERLMLRASVISDDQTVQQDIAFNDIVLHGGDISRMVEFDTFVNGQLINSHRADGVVVSTPTGSTAYALSGGGPVLHPALDAIVLVPICPHTLSDRPIVIDADSSVELVVAERNTTPTLVSWDGQINHALQPGDRVRINRTNYKVTVLHPGDYHYFEILRNKLHWGMTPADGQAER